MRLRFRSEFNLTRPIEIAYVSFHLYLIREKHFVICVIEQTNSIRIVPTLLRNKNVMSNKANSDIILYLKRKTRRNVSFDINIEVL